MIKKLLLSLIMALVAVPMTWAASLVEQGNQAYGDEHYNKALELYLNAQETQGTSSQLCYNIGNTYYRLKDIPHAILYLERALILDPGNSDARFNLDFVREKSAINEDNGDTYFSTRILSTVAHISSNGWALMGIITFLMFICALAAYLFMDNVAVRKVGFFGGAILLVVSIIANVCAFYMYGKAVNHDTAIVTVEGPVQVSTSPRTPKDKSEVAFLIKEGYKVTITDSVVSQGTTWFDIETSDLRRGWINAKSIERI